MSKGKHKRRSKGGGQKAPAPSPDEFLARATEIAAALQADGAEAALWGQLHKALSAAKADPAEVMPMVMGRDLNAIDHLIARLRGDEPPLEEPATADEPSAPPVDVPAETKRQAMKAFRRRMKLMRLDHESKLGVGPLTGGKAADFDSILPPHDYPDEVWQALAADGQLRSTGRGFYALP